MIYRYYAVKAPVSIAGVPKGFVNHHNFQNGRMYISSIGRKAYGYVEYDHPVQRIDREKYALVEEFLPR